MTWMLRPKLPDSTSFNGEIVYNSTDYVVKDFYKYVDSVNFNILSQFVVKEKGFEKNKYKRTDSSTIEISLGLTGDIPRWLFQQLYNLAIAINGMGMIVQYKDQFVNGTIASPLTYDCRWINTGDFVENSILSFGGSIELIAYTLPAVGEAAVAGGEYVESLGVPATGEEWQEVLNDADADEVYHEVL